MAADLYRAFRQAVETRLQTDYAAAGGTLLLVFPNVDLDRDDSAGYVNVTWQLGNTLGSSFYARRQMTPFIIFCQIFVPRGTGTETAATQADLLADVMRGQSWTVIANTPTLVTPNRNAVDGANQVDSIVTATARLDDPVATPIGPDPGGALYQVNVTTEGRLLAKYGETA